MKFKKLSKIGFSLVTALSLLCTTDIENVSAKDINVETVDYISNQVYQYNQTSKNNEETRVFDTAPIYLIYPDKKVDENGAKKVLTDLGITNHIEEYATVAYIMNPVNDTYDNDMDKQRYIQMLDYLADKDVAGFEANNSNIKVIGIGKGATFVNDVISLNSWCIAGIMTYGGTRTDTTTKNIPVPAYLHGQNSKTIQYYVNSNEATKISSENKLDTYVSTSNKLQRVVVSQKTDIEESLAQAFENAWKNIFCKNYRMNNNEGEFYNLGFTKFKHPYELVSYVMYDDLNMTCDSVTGSLTKDATEDKPNQWYQYFPKNLSSKEKSSVPLVILLHGNTNDNRIQAETSGWIEKASKEGFACVAPEWQASSYCFSGEKYTRLYEEGTMALIDYLVEKYPQLDASRVYLTGISAGAKRAEEWGITNSKKIAAVEATAGRERNDIIQSAIENKQEGCYVPLYVMGGTNDTIVTFPIKKSDIENNEQSPYHSILAYCHINDIKIPAFPDLKLNKYYGIALDNQGTYMYNHQQVYAGTLSNDVGVMLKAVTLEPYAHWNSKEMIDDIWDFFKNYARDIETGELIYLAGTKEYKMIQGNHQTIIKGNDASFTSEAKVNRFDKVIIDDNIINSSNYILDKEITKITLTSEFIDTLSAGEHTIIIKSLDGKAISTFIVQEEKIDKPDNPEKPNDDNQHPSDVEVDKPNKPINIDQDNPKQNITNIKNNPSHKVKTDDMTVVSLYIILIIGSLGTYLTIKKKERV